MRLVLLCVLLLGSLSDALGKEKHEPGESKKILQMEDEAFAIFTQNASIKDFSTTTVDLRSEQHNYKVRLEPKQDGNVVFSVSGIAYRSTFRFKNLLFRIKVTGYKADKVIMPTVSVDDVNEHIEVDRNTITFSRIHGTLPVLFHQEVDSIYIEYANSLGADISQYLKIEDLKIVGAYDVLSNPVVNLEEQQNVMIAIDGSSSIIKKERKAIGKELTRFVKTSDLTKDSSLVTVAEYGTNIKSIKTSFVEKEVLKELVNYRKSKNQNKKKSSSWTNWTAVFEKALEQKPTLLIFVTDGLSNWENDQPATFTSVYHSLIEKCNLLKENGTRIMFITSDMHLGGQGNSLLNTFLNGPDTKELFDVVEPTEQTIREVDLISLRSFNQMKFINFSSIMEAEVVDADLYEDKLKLTIDEQ